MKEVKVYTIWLSIMAAIIVILCMLGGYWERGYFAFDSSFIILTLSPIVIGYCYQVEKREYYRRKYK
jgi:hypothetical protein